MRTGLNKLALDTPNGNILVLVFLFIIGIGMAAFRITKAEDVIVGTLSGILAILAGNKKASE